MTAQTLASAGGERQAENRLVRTYSLGDMVRHAVVFMVLIAPMGIFGSVFQAAGGMVALAYLVGAVVMLMTASSFGILAQAYQAAFSLLNYEAVDWPRTGSTRELSALCGRPYVGELHPGPAPAFAL